MRKIFDDEKLNDILGSGGISNKDFNTAKNAVCDWLKYGNAEPLRIIAKKINLTPEELIYWFRNWC